MEQLLLILLVVMVPFALWYGLYRRSTLRQLRGQLEQIANELTEPTMQLHDTLESLRRNIELVRTTYTSEEATQIIASSDEQLIAGDSLVVQRSGMTERRNRALSAYTPDPINQAIDAWQDLRRETRKLLRRLRTEDDRLSHALTAAQRAPERLARAEEMIEEVRSSIAAAEERGFVMTMEREVADLAEERATEIRRLLDERRFRAAEGPLTRLTKELTETRDNLLSLRRRRSELSSRLDELHKAQRRLRQRLQYSRESYRTLARQYAHRTWTGLDTHIDQGRDEMNRAASDLDTVEQMLESGDMGHAERAARSAASAQAEAERELSVPVERLVKMRELATTLPERKDALVARAAGLAQQATSEKSTRSFTGVAKELQAQLSALDMTVSQPDWMTFEERLDELEQLITGLEVGIRHAGVVARDQQRHIDRLRRWNEEAHGDNRYLPRSWWE